MRRPRHPSVIRADDSTAMGVGGGGGGGRGGGGGGGGGGSHPDGRK